MTILSFMLAWAGQILRLHNLTRRCHWATKTLIILLPVLMWHRPAAAGPCVYLGGAWCEIWSPEMLVGFGEATTAILAAITAAVSALTLAFTSMVNLQILPEIWGAGAKVTTAIEMSSAREKVTADGEAALITGKSYAYGSQIGLPGSIPKGADEAVSATQVKGIGMQHANKVCNELVTQAQVTPLVSSGSDIAADAMNTRLLNSMRTSRMADAQASYNRHATSYCSLSDVFNGICYSAAPDHLQNLDVMPPGFVTNDEAKTTQLSEEEKRAGQAWIENIVGLGNYPANDYSEDTYNSDARKAFSGANNVIQARMSGVAHSLNSQIARRSKVVVVFNADNSARADVSNQIADANPNLAQASMTTGTPEAEAKCSPSTDYAQYEAMGTPAVRKAIDDSYSNGDMGASLKKFGVSAYAWHYYAYVESSKNPNAVGKFGFFGLYQMGKGALMDVGMSGLLPTAIFDPYQNGLAAKKYAIQNIGLMNSAFPSGVKGVPPIFVLYGMHNMGPTGFKEIYDNITTGKPLSASRKKAIQENVNPRVPLDQITGQMYWEFWRKKFNVNAC